METIKEYLIPLVLSNFVFGLALVAAIRSPMIARVFLAVGFIGASVFNTWTVLHTPDIYLTYADFALLEVYRDFIEGFFARNIQVCIGTIAGGQLLIGLGLILNGWWTRLACLGGMIFGAAIGPLGIGSAFPSTILLAFSFYVIFKAGEHDFIWKWNQYRKSQPIKSQVPI